jgi:hypothetical protein
VMAVDLRTDKPRIFGHMITRDLTHNSLVLCAAAVLLQKSLSTVAQRKLLLLK